MDGSKDNAQWLTRTAYSPCPGARRRIGGRPPGAGRFPAFRVTVYRLSPIKSSQQHISPFISTPLKFLFKVYIVYVGADEQMLEIYFSGDACFVRASAVLVQHAQDARRSGTWVWDLGLGPRAAGATGHMAVLWPPWTRGSIWHCATAVSSYAQQEIHGWGRQPDRNNAERTADSQI